MAARSKLSPSNAKQSTKGKNTVDTRKQKNAKVEAEPPKEPLIEKHLPPLSLVAIVLICSGALFVLCIRDFLATGKVIGGDKDNAFLTFTKSMDWFDDSKGWKSQQGGLSAIKPATTDANNMGGFFVRKLAGAAGLAVQLQKLLPLLAHPKGAQWSLGHFRPLLFTAILTNSLLAAFYGTYLEDLDKAGAGDVPRLVMGLLAVESIAMYFFLMRSKPEKGPATAMTEGRTPTSFSSRIVTRTVGMVSSVIALVAIRDLCFPGFIMKFFPRDDIYLEWTNAFFHSPPDGSQEAYEQGLEAPLYIGDKFVGQLMAMNVLICCIYKMVSAFGIRYGSDGGGLVKAKMIWRGMGIADALTLLTFRLFASAAVSASLDLRWHIMALSYETFILGLYGFM